MSYCDVFFFEREGERERERNRERERKRRREKKKERKKKGRRRGLDVRERERKKKKKNGGQKTARFFSLTSFFFSSKQLSLPLSLDPKVFPAHQRKLLETVTQLAFPSANGDIHKMAGRLVVRERF